MRLAIIGSAGSGKTYLGECVAREFDLRPIDLDLLFWEPGWGRNPSFEQELRRAAQDDNILLVGNYIRYASKFAQWMDVVIWLDISAIVCLTRVLRRSVEDIVTSREVLPGCRQSVRSMAEVVREAIRGRQRSRVAVRSAVMGGLLLPGQILRIADRVTCEEISNLLRCRLIDLKP